MKPLDLMEAAREPAALPDDAFDDLGSLRVLRLDGNALQALPPGLFHVSV